MAELVDAADSKSVFERSGSSSLPRGTKIKKGLALQGLFFRPKKSHHRPVQELPKAATFDLALPHLPHHWDISKGFPSWNCHWKPSPSSPSSSLTRRKIKVRSCVTI